MNDPSTRRKVGAVVAGALVPGSGHLIVRHRRAGFVWLSIWAAVMVTAGVWALLNASSTERLIATALSRPTLGWFVAWACTLAVVILAAQLDLVRRLLRPASTRARRWPVVAVASVAALVVAAVPAATAQLATTQISVLGQIFGIHNLGTSAYGLPSTPDHYNIAVFGLDSEGGPAVVHPDISMLVSINERTGKVTVFNLARDFNNFGLAPGTVLAQHYPEGYRCEVVCTLHTLYGLGQEHPSWYPEASDPGLAAMQEGLASLTGIAPDAVATVEFSALVDVVDAIGGLHITVPQETTLGTVSGPNGEPPVIRAVLQPGEYTFDGATTLDYVRSRLNADNASRMQRQAQVIQALWQQLGPAQLLTQYNRLAQISTQSISVSASSQQVGELAGDVLRGNGGVDVVVLSQDTTTTTNPDLTALHAQIRGDLGLT